ncbi:MAG: hypothetical protein NXH91_03380 [Phyllobacteriaceae bacterium]|jgi:hypothetical protein|nr:hypothetical protein [Phyllobacteriaceae bacterium]
MAWKLKSLNVNLPFNLGGATIEIGEAERVAAWRLYVEMATRVSTQPLRSGEGSVREALTSIYQLFEITRSELKQAGPDIGQSASDLGPIAIRILNEGLRPFLTRWHSAYADFETAEAQRMMRGLGMRAPPIDLVDQATWPRVEEFYNDLEEIRKAMLQYVDMLAEICGALDVGTARGDPAAKMN